MPYALLKFGIVEWPAMCRWLRGQTVEEAGARKHFHIDVNVLILVNKGEGKLGVVRKR